MLSKYLQASAGNAGENAVSGQAVFTAGWATSGGQTQSYSWVVPDGVSKISAVCIGAGQTGSRSDTTAQGGDAGDLRYINSLAVTPGETLTIEVGKGVYNQTLRYDGGTTSILRGGTTLLRAAGAVTSTPIGGNVGGGDGGAGGSGNNTTYAGGGGGTGGYAGNGGNGQTGSGIWAEPDANSGAAYGGARSATVAQGGGGVGLVKLGQTGSGTAATSQWGSGGYSCGTNSTFNTGLYGAGGGGNDGTSGYVRHSAPGGCRIIWGEGRTYPDASDNYALFSDVAYSEIEIRIMTPHYYLAENYVVDTFTLGLLSVKDENDNNVLASLTAVTGGPSASMSSISTGQFTMSAYEAPNAGQMQYWTTGEYALVYAQQVSETDAFGVYIKPSSPKKIKSVSLYCNSSYQNSMVHYIEIYGDGELISFGQLVPERTFDYSLNTHVYTVDLV